MPSENKLPNKFKVSRLTVGQGISQLVRKGFLIRKRIEGTFVTTNTNFVNSFGLEFIGFMDDLFYQVSRSKTKSAKMTRMIAPKTIKDKLKLDDGEDEVIKIERLRFLRDKPFAYTINYLPIEIGEKSM